ncbi:MAG: caspase family protein [Cyanobacteriota bacterium]|nr:caspase family protein [Cyanobacteriota bacterium]
MQRKAVLCGVNAYKSSPHLRGCLNDVDNLQNLLVDTFGFANSEIRVLKDAEAIKSNIEREWQWLTSGAGKDDVLVFHFSGHGSHVADLDGDEEDGRDEITCLYDMDFNNPQSYILDDEWYEWVKGVNPEANLIILKDTCHSGGSSRLLSVANEAGFGEMILVEDSALQQLGPRSDASIYNVPDGRFLIPQDVPMRDWSANRHLLRINADSLNGLHLMACQEHQTAADAYINGAFQGAFTYYLCDVLRSNQHLDSQTLIERIGARLSRDYSQVPNHEGQGRTGPIFGSGAPSDKISLSLSSVPAPSSLELSGTDTAQALIGAYLKLLETVTQLERPSRVFDGARQLPSCLVAVHGIGNHSTQYSDPWWAALKPHVSPVYPQGVLGQERREVIWSDLVNRARTANTTEAEALKQAILDAIEDRREHELSSASPRSWSEMPVTRGSEIAIDDFLVYMVNPEMRQRIIRRFTDVVYPLLEQGTHLDLISHSWGTVVAYEGLRELETHTRLTGRVNTFFTVGSALSLGPVQQTLRPGNKPSRDRKAPRPRLVKRWFNLDAKGDLVGGALSRKFEIDQEFLQLEPTGCAPKLWGYDLVCAHSSYFRSDNLAVNRDIFARHILGGS